MRVLLLGFSKIAYMPFVNFYLEQLGCNENEVHLLYWNRDNKKEISLPFKLILHEFKSYQEDEVSKYKKLYNFIKYRKYAKKVLQNYRFDLIIVLSTFPGILLYRTLKKQFDNNYIFDYRDFTFENIKIFKYMVCNLVFHSKATFISSNAYREYLPNVDKIYLSHNILVDSLRNRRGIENNKSNQKVIKIGYWGFIRHENINKSIINQLTNDSRFELHYFGREQKIAYSLKEYCNKNNIKNVYFHGEYTPKERYEFLKTIDMLNNLVEDEISTSKAMTNKYYDGIVFYIPQICIGNSFMGELVDELKVGIACDPNEKNFSEKIYNYYNSIDWDEFEKKCNLELKRILREYNLGKKIIEQYIKQY